MDGKANLPALRSNSAGILYIGSKLGAVKSVVREFKTNHAGVSSVLFNVIALRAPCSKKSGVGVGVSSGVWRE